MTWTDVTRQCEVHDDGVYMGDQRIFEPDYANGYRLRKVERYSDATGLVTTFLLLEQETP